MNYHDIKHDDMLNGEGLRVTLFLSGCNHHCPNCQNPETWNESNGIEFDVTAKEEIMKELRKPYITGITFSGGDPLHENNIKDVYDLIIDIRLEFENKKTIWLYSGYTWEDLFSRRRQDNMVTICEDQLRRTIILGCDVLVDGKYIKEQDDINYHWAGSRNQRVIDIRKTIDNLGVPVLLES
jgi:anaerobic ribonucleoside-triphosphate reductase activating protein